MIDKRLGRAHARVANALVNLEDIFEPRCLLTFIMRDPEKKEAYMIVSTDSEEKLIELIELLQHAATTKPRVRSMEEILAERLGI